MRCARCRTVVAPPAESSDWPEPSLAPADAELDPVGEPAAKAEQDDPFCAAQWSAAWDFDEDLAEADRLLRRVGVPRPKFTLRGGGERRPGMAIQRIDPPSPVPKLKLRFTPHPKRGRHLPILPRLMVDIGLVGFLTGVTMLVWSFLADQTVVWQIGLAIVTGGQVVLLAGLVLQFDFFRRSHQQAYQDLSHVNKQLTDLRQATARLSTAPDDSGRSFYVHMAEGANPHILLADLKGQLDALAQQLARDD